MNKAEERYYGIIEILKLNPIVTVAEFAECLSVSPETIRKDLNVLAEKGLVMRIHGGAALAGDKTVISPFQFRETVNQKEKQALARAACDMISPGDSLIVESSTTMVELVKILVERKELLETLTIVTNSVHIVTLLEMGRLCARLFLLGGWMRESEQSTQGQLTAAELKNFHVDKCLLSGAALGRNLVLTSFYEDDMLFQKQAMKSASQSILLLEAGKYPSTAVLAVAPLTQFDHLITNIPFDEEQNKKLGNSNLKLTYINTAS